MRNDRNLGSFRIDTLNGQWRDHAIGHGGSDAISLYAYLSTGGDYREAYKRLANDSLVRAAIAAGTQPTPANVAQPAKDDPATLAFAHRQSAPTWCRPVTVDSP